MLPAIFFGHGNPMNALLRNACTDAVASDRRAAAAADSDSLDLRALVCAGNRCDHRDFAITTCHCYPSLRHAKNGEPVTFPWRASMAA
jgi:hypothetical protein